MRNDRKKRKRLQRTKCKEDEALNAVSVRIQKEAIQKDRFLALARKYYLKWRQVNEAHKKLQSKANNLSMSSRFGTNPRSCTLYHALRSPTITLTKYCAGKIMLELCQALQHLHLKQLLHRDIKSDNILLTTLHTGFHPMLIDFGKSIEVSEAISKKKCLSAHEQDDYREKYRHIAPEIILGQPPSFASDLFSFGVVMSDVS
ncbi:hypothetical protein OS493_030437, partial [Desmophyllum pertusum]